LKFALGVEAEILFIGFSPRKRLPRKTRPFFAGFGPEKNGNAQNINTTKLIFSLNVNL